MTIRIRMGLADESEPEVNMTSFAFEQMFKTATWDGIRVLWFAERRADGHLGQVLHFDRGTQS